MWKSGRNINSRRAALAEGYMEDTQESRGRKFFREHSHDTGTFYYVGAHDRGEAMIFNYDFHGADLIALLFAFMVLYSGVVAVLTDK